ncbi:MAG: helix-turn-helix domain-containing protein [Burkholderiales bacterium]
MSVAVREYEDVIAVLIDLPVLVRHERRVRGLSLRDVADQSGVTFSTVSRVENGSGCHLRNAIALLTWINDPAADDSGKETSE